ncbi:glutaredoxin family protein [Paenibacillus hamazuiensis]|uniref:glutaredoxin family protein n=1 Tax=Paenibacillus hamazuiensis TaxID=2936508 RepID=UPI0020104E93|nr:glutaredoxin family protein [Paenibacillus hamazuiensis]
MSVNSCVTVYSGTDCIYCAQLKEYLNQQNIVFVEKNIDLNEQYAAELKEMGMATVPLTVIGDKKILGLNPTRIKKALAELNGTAS